MDNATNSGDWGGTLYGETISTGGEIGQDGSRGWSLVVDRATRGTARGQGAIESLCAGYWYPLYGYVRSAGYSAAVAGGTTELFRTRLREGAMLDEAGAKLGRFPEFSWMAIERILQDVGLRGEDVPAALCVGEGERRYLRESRDDEPPERAYARRWTLAVLDRVMEKMRGEFERHGRLDHFQYLKAHLVSQGDAPYAELAKTLEISESALRSGLHRIRKRYRDALRAEVASTVADSGGVDAELRYLFAAVQNR